MLRIWLKRGRHGGQIKTHCINGHEYNKENTYIEINGHRKCKQCKFAEHRTDYGKWRKRVYDQKRYGRT